ncbi:MAG TPA: hypothetical protein VGF48_12050 [Thermoanaerobaculia bacterium]
MYLGGQRPGAHGAVWSDALTVMNDSDRPLVQGVDFLPFEPCPFECGQTIEPGTGQNINFFVPEPQAVPALLMQVRRPLVERLFMTLRVWEQSRPVRQATRVPLVREEEFRSNPLNLVLVEKSSAVHRTLLRIYELDAAPGATVRVHAFELFGGRPVADRLVRLTVPIERYEPQFGGGPVYPGYAEVPLDDTFFGPGLDPRFVFRIRVEPVVAGQRLWSMVSVTENGTNEFTLITPEP